MEIHCSSCALVMLLLSLEAASPGNSPRGLLCVNDFIHTLSCVWLGPTHAPHANCSITGEKEIWIRRKHVKTQSGKMIRSCRLEQHHNAPPGCSFAFENAMFNMNGKIGSIRMECDGRTLESLRDYEPRQHVKMNPPGEPEVNATANATWISWGTGGGPWSVFTTSRFQAQIRRKGQLWEEASNLFTEDLKVKVWSQQFTGLCEVRVRVQPSVPPNQHWSNWSPTTSWLRAAETAGAQPDNDVSEWILDQTGLLCSLGFVFVVVLLLSAGCWGKRVVKKKPVPTPSKYFGTLQSLYQGNLKAWLNPAEAFFAAPVTEGLSWVEVCDVKASAPSSVSTFAPMQSGPSASPDTDGGSSWSSSSSSFYTNIGYFLSSSSGSSAPAMRGPDYFKYPDEDDSGNAGITVSLCSSCGNTGSSEGPEEEPQGPDSGFSFEKEDEAEKEDADVPEDQICPLLVLSPSHLSMAESADGGSVCRSSSMNVEPCRTGYLTLKELHMTFSNKSI